MPTVRPARSEDHDTILRLWETCGLGQTTEDEWRAITSGSPDMLLIAEEDGALVGAIVASFDGWRAFVYHLAVAPEMRRRGIGRVLIEEAERQLKARGARRIFALVNERNTEGIALCVATGYEPEGDVAFVKELPA
jgi:ribosomal protein S18 acetylase RimI-like enzyme